jgi:hypothetical protein
MNEFCPDGYVPTQEAIIRAAQYWFPEGFAALERAAVPPPETKPDNSSEALARALSPPPVIPNALRHEFQNIVNQTAHRLRNVLHQGKLKGYYFGGLFDKGRQVVSREFWATQEADGVLEAGIYWPFDRPNAWHERRPSYPLFLAQSELDALLSKQQTSKKRPFPSARKSQLVDTLRKLDQLPNRAAQLRALRDMPEFCEFKITEALFREAAKQVPRDPGRKSRRQS